MSATNRDVQLIHPIFQKNMYNILNAIKKKLPENYTCKMVSGHRTQAEQFDLYKQGRVFRRGSWVVSDARKVVTNINGITLLSNHNYLPCISMDIGIFDNTGKYLGDSSLYKYVKEGAKAIGSDWGGDWINFKDRPHIELSEKQLFKGSKIREMDYQWQLLLSKDGTYTGALDGFFGSKSLDALKKSVGIRERNVESWKKLVAKVGI